MQKLKDAAKLADEVRVTLKSRGLVTGTEIARASGLGQPQVHRNLFGQPKRAGRTLLALCKYAGINAYERASRPADSPVLMQALAEVWDGSEAHARKLAKLLLAYHQARM